MLRLILLHMVVAQKMECAMHQQVLGMRAEALSLLPGLTLDGLQRQYDIAQMTVSREGKHVGRLVLAAKITIETAYHLVIGQHDRYFCTSLALMQKRRLAGLTHGLAVRAELSLPAFAFELNGYLRRLSHRVNRCLSSSYPTRRRPE